MHETGVQFLSAPPGHQGLVDDTNPLLLALLSGGLVDFSGFTNDIISFAQNHTVIVIVVAIGLLILLYRKPKLFFGMLFLGLLAAGLFYLIMSLSGPSKENKEKLLQEEEEKQVDTGR